MSSTNRSAARDLHISDYYVTPLHTITEFTRAFTQDAPTIGFDVNAPMNVLDPCAGGDFERLPQKRLTEEQAKLVPSYFVAPIYADSSTGRVITNSDECGWWEAQGALTEKIAHPMAYPAALINHSGWNVQHVRTIDIREDSLAEEKGDYLTRDFGHQFDMTITNPPFNIALDVIQKALHDTRPGGLVVMLLRLNFFGSRERQSFWHKHMPILTYVHTRRPKFLNTGGTDSIEYMHAVWQVGNYPKHLKLRII